MTRAKRQTAIRRSISLAPELDAKEAEKRRFYELAERLQTTKNQSELQEIKQELARLTFGA